MILKGKKMIVLAEQMFHDLEFWYPYYRLREAGAHVVVVGSGSASEYAGKFGTTVHVDFKAEHISPVDYDGMVIPGGYAPDIMRRHPSMVRLVRDFHSARKIVAAICHAGWMLASAGIVKGRTVTSFYSIKDDLIHAGANWVDEEVVVDGTIITSRMPDDLPVFMRSILYALE